MTQKALFIPLCAEPYEGFAAGTKVHELREYGPRWTAEVCAIGRAVTLSKGYGKQNRLSGVIVSYSRTPARFLSKGYQEAVKRHYGTLDIDVAVIGINVKENEK